MSTESIKTLIADATGLVGSVLCLVLKDRAVIIDSTKARELPNLEQYRR